jgi:hypothetical protein
MHNSKLLQSLSFQIALDSPISAQLQRSVLAAFAPQDTFFLHNFSLFLYSQTLQSFVQIYPENCLNRYVLSLEFFTADFHLHRQATRIQNEDKGDRSNNGSAQKFKHTEIGEEAIAMAVQTLDGLLPYPLLRRVAVQSAGERLCIRPASSRNVTVHATAVCGNALALCSLLSPPISRTTDSYPPSAKTNFDKFC